AGGIVTTDLGALDIAKALLLQPEGKIVAAGTTHTTGQSVTPIGMARYNADGSLDTGFGVNGKVMTDFGENEVVSAIARQSDGKIVVAGSIEGSNTSQRFFLAPYNANGRIDIGFGVNGEAGTRHSRGLLLPGSRSRHSAGWQDCSRRLFQYRSIAGHCARALQHRRLARYFVRFERRSAGHRFQHEPPGSVRPRPSA